MYNKNQNAYYRKAYKENPEKYRAINRASYQRNKAARDLRAKNYQKQARIDCINHYSHGTNACACCGVTGIVFLTLDHINGDGAKLRRDGVHKTGTMFAIWLRKNGYPEGIQVLCHNCNQAKRQLPNCPHLTT